MRMKGEGPVLNWVEALKDIEDVQHLSPISRFGKGGLDRQHWTNSSSHVTTLWSHKHSDNQGGPKHILFGQNGIADRILYYYPCQSR